MFRKIMIALIASILFLAPEAEALDSYQIDPAHSSIQFAVKHLVITTVRGSFSDFTGSLTCDEESDAPVSLGGSIRVSSISTLEEKRDTHLKSADFFDAEKYPNITFLSSGISKSGTSFMVSGLLIMHGVEKNISFPIELSDLITDPWGKTRRALSGTLTVDRTHFDISWSNRMDNGGLVVGNDVTITLDFELVKQMPQINAE